MKFKIFKGEDWQAVEKAVNDWLKGQSPAPSIRLSETAMHVTTAGGRKVGIATVSVWYD